MTWCWHFPHQDGTGAVDGEGIRPETDPAREWLRGNKLSLHLMRNHGEGVSGLNLGQTQCHPLSESGFFLFNRSHHWCPRAYLGR